MDTAVVMEPAFVVPGEGQQLPVFEGPLDLLLHLIAKNKVEITDIPVALILEQYMDYLGQMHELDMEITSSFIVMAAQLIYIKTQLLLPKPAEEEAEDPRAELAEALLLYRRIKRQAELLRPLTEIGVDRIPKPPSPLSDIPAEYHHTPQDLLRALRLMGERARRVAVPKAESFAGVVGREPVPVEEKIAQVLTLLLQKKSVELTEIFRGARSRSELVALFLAVLELMNDRRVHLSDSTGTQTLSFGEEKPESAKSTGNTDKESEM